MATTKSRKKPQITDEHLQALAQGRSEGSAIRRYLSALEEHKPKRGRKRTPDSIARRLSIIEEQIEQADPLSRVHLIQERMDLENALEATRVGIDIEELEEEFVKAAKAYGERKRITYTAWREAGVPAAILKRADIRRSGI